MVGFIGNQDDFVLAKVFKGQGIFLFAGQIGVQLLNRGEADADVIGVDRFKVFDGRNVHAAIPDVNVRIEQVLDAGGVEKVVFGFFDDVGGMDEEQEVAIALLVEIENQSRHDERFTAARRHVEQEVQGVGFAGEVVVVAVDEAGKGLHLIGAQFVARVQVTRNALGNFLFDAPPLRKRIELFVEKLFGHLKIPVVRF